METGPSTRSYRTRLPLTLWFLAIYHVTGSKKGISYIELGRRLADMIESLARDALRAAPIPYSLLTLAEADV